MKKLPRLLVLTAAVGVVFAGHIAPASAQFLAHSDGGATDAVQSFGTVPNSGGSETFGSTPKQTLGGSSSDQSSMGDVPQGTQTFGDVPQQKPPVSTTPKISSGVDSQATTTTSTSTTTSTTPVPVCPSLPAARVSSFNYTINGVSNLPTMASVTSGGVLSVQFTVAPGCTNVEVSIVTYDSPSGTFNRNTAGQQVVFDQATGMFDAGVHTLAVDVPQCFFQVDFVRGPVIVKLGPAGSSNFYGDQGRLIEAKSGGQACTTTTTTQPPTVQQVTTTTSTTLPTQVLGEQIVKGAPAEPQVEHAQLARTGSDSGSLVMLGMALFVVGAFLNELASGYRRRESGRHFRI